MHYKEIEISVGADRRSPYLALIKKAGTKASGMLPVRAWKVCRRGASYDVAISVIGPKRMQELNRTFRKKDRPTDVLAFPAWEAHPGENHIHIGDICLCPTVARKNAKELGHSLEQELRILTVHGLLHLFGYDHETNDADAKRMFKLQAKIVASL